ncbi:MAG TPA: AAA family ATPase, partial [Pseudobdellovibrionaceae bacterium]|nr:AAA family ATPase [Pseudobdellovibrionaceae bacterium]
MYLHEIWSLERDVARKLLAFETRAPSWGWFNSPKVLNWAQSLLDINLAPLQKTAIETALSSSLTVITGGPGTGKTTLIRSLVTILQTQFAQFALCSPTGRAAQRLEDATGVPAQTLHRLLKYESLTDRFAYDKNHPLPVDLVLIDEVSMVDLALFSRLLDALPEHCSLVLVGDADQLPSIGPGTILQSLIASRRFPTVRLTEVFRQQGQSQITLNAQRINAGLMPVVSSGQGRNDFHYLPVQGVPATKEVLLDLLHRVIPEKYGITDPSQCQVLVPLNKGELGTQKLNLDLQRFFSHEAQRGFESVQGMEQVFKEGDKVMVTRNDYRKGVFNGDIGFIQKIDSRAQSMDVHFETKTVRFEFDELDRLSLAYAISIHKAQGSEYRVAIVVIAKEHLSLAQRHLLYTAVTRGKEQVFLVADPETL